MTKKNDMQEHLLRLCMEPRMRDIALRAPTINQKWDIKAIEFQSRLIRTYNENEFINAYPETFAHWKSAKQALAKRLADAPYRSEKKIDDFISFAAYLFSELAADASCSIKQRIFVSDLIRYRLAILRSLRKKLWEEREGYKDPFYARDRAAADIAWVNPTLIVEAFRSDISAIEEPNPKIGGANELLHFAFFFSSREAVEADVLQVSEDEAVALSHTVCEGERLGEAAEDLRAAGLF
jgi:hypothetical protein